MVHLVIILAIGRLQQDYGGFQGHPRLHTLTQNKDERNKNTMTVIYFHVTFVYEPYVSHGLHLLTWISTSFHTRVSLSCQIKFNLSNLIVHIYVSLFLNLLL